MVFIESHGISDYFAVHVCNLQPVISFHTPWLSEASTEEPRYRWMDPPNMEMVEVSETSIVWTNNLQL